MRTVLLVILVGLAVWALPLDPRQLSVGGLSAMGDFLVAALHPAVVDEGGLGVALLPVAAAALRGTMVFAVSSLGIAMIAAVPLGVLSATRLWQGRRGRRLCAAARVLSAAMRAVHELIWAIVLLAALGLSHAVGVVAIAIPYTGILARVLGALLDEAPDDTVAVLRAGGAGPWQAAALGLLPRVVPDWLACCFSRLECAMRSSAVLGFFGFPTLGYHIHAAAGHLHYREVWTFLYALLALIVAMDLWSGAIRRRLVPR